jgi:hypothetical protein
MTNEQLIEVHAFAIRHDGSEEFCYPDDEKPSGWSCYRRIETPSDHQQPFDVDNEFDFETKEQAIAKAEELAIKFGLCVDDIHHNY